MDPGHRSPLVDAFLRGQVDRETRMLAARGALAAEPLDQLALLVLLWDHPDQEVAATAKATLDTIPPGSLEAFLERAHVPEPMRVFFGARGLVPAAGAGPAEPAEPEHEAADEPSGPEAQEAERTALSALPIVERVKIAMKGSRTQRGLLIRDSNKMVSTAVLSSPKLTETEVEAFARMGNVSEDVLRIIAGNRAWTKNYAIVSALARNPKTPPAIAMQFVPRLNARDIKALSVDRNVPEAVRVIARKFVVKTLR